MSPPPSQPVSRPAAYTVGSVWSALRILRSLRQAKQPVRLMPIARELGINPSTCLNILRTMVDEGFVEYQPVMKAYALGRAALDLGRDYLADWAASDMVQPLLDDFSYCNRASVILWRRIADRELVTVAHSSVGAIVQLRALVGTRVPLLSGSMGRAVAGAEAHDQEWLMERFAEARHTGSSDFSAFLDGVRQARRQGWATDHSSYGGVNNALYSGIAAPVPDSGRVAFVVSTVFFEKQLTPAQTAEIGTELIGLAQKIAVRTFGPDSGRKTSSTASIMAEEGNARRDAMQPQPGDGRVNEYE